jgi:hypothetical protein
MTHTDTNTDKISFESNSYCGYFLLWFQSLISDNFSLPDFYRNLPEHQKKVYDEEKTKVKNCCTSWKDKFSHLLEVFWNNSTFLSLINQNCPLLTMVGNLPDGFSFVIDLLADNIFSKVFYGVEKIENVPFVQYESNEDYNETVYLITKTG